MGEQSRHKVLREAEFDPAIKTYWVLSTIIICVVCIVTIPLIPVIVLIVFWFMDRWIARLKCTLTDRTLEIKKGVLNRVQSTIPLEKITDLQMYQGPIMRMLGIEGFKVETAGQSVGPGGSLVNMVGIVNTEDFREAVLEQRDRLAAREHAHPSSPVGTQASAVSDEGAARTLEEISATLKRIEGHLANK